MTIRFEVFDGTCNPKWGLAAKRSIEDLAVAVGQNMAVPRYLGGEDLVGYRVVQQLVERNWNRGRSQARLNGLIDDVVQIKNTRVRDPRVTLLLLENDIYADGLNWCFGQSTPGVVAVSINRLDQSLGRDGTYMFQDLISHELGHQFGAARQGRTLTEENLGSHCLVDLCVMQQKLGVGEAVHYAERRLRANAEPYCNLCSDDLSGSSY